jgi:hypothetical protein
MLSSSSGSKYLATTDLLHPRTLSDVIKTNLIRSGSGEGVVKREQNAVAETVEGRGGDPRPLRRRLSPFATRTMSAITIRRNSLLR